MNKIFESVMSGSQKIDATLCLVPMYNEFRAIADLTRKDDDDIHLAIIRGKYVNEGISAYRVFTHTIDSDDEAFLENISKMFSTIEVVDALALKQALYHSKNSKAGIMNNDLITTVNLLKVDNREAWSALISTEAVSIVEKKDFCLALFSYGKAA